MQRNEENLPPDLITILEQLVYNMGSQESGDTSNLGTD